MSERSIINTYDQCCAAGGERVVIFRHNQVTGRGYRCASWQVGIYKNGTAIPTDPKAAWYDYGKKTFPCFGRSERDEKLKEAIAWAEEKYGPRVFVKNRLGDYVEKEVNDNFPIPKREKVKA